MKSSRNIALVLITAGAILPACDRSHDRRYNSDGTVDTDGNGYAASTQPGGSSSNYSTGYYSNGTWISRPGYYWTGHTWTSSPSRSFSSGNGSSSHVGSSSESHGSSFGGFGSHGSSSGGE